MSNIAEEKLSPLDFPSLSSQSLAVNHRRILRKLDLHLFPFVSLLYFLSFLDRTNIGNAKIARLVEDLNLTGLQYNLCSAIFFIPCCFFAVPSTIAMKFLKPSRWLPLTMFCWGIVLLSMAFVRNFPGLLVARIFLGVTEAGLFPGATLYICLWYPRAAQAQRVSLLLSAATLAGAFGGILAFGIEKMSGIGGLKGWSWIFLLEGLLTVAVAVFSYIFMYDYPETASFLTSKEKEWLIQTIKSDTADSSKQFKWQFLFQALRDLRVYLLIGVYLFIFIPTFSFALFLPTIIAGLGYSDSHAQLLSIPPYVSGCIFTVVSGMLSDRLNVRGPFVLGGTVLAIIGYVMLFATTSPVVGYVGTVIASWGLFPAAACVLAWTGGNMGGDVKRGAVIAIVTGIGNLGGIASSFIYRPQDSPRYHPGHATNISCLCAASALSIIAMFEFSRLNRKKIERCVNEGITGERIEEFREMGDESPLYRYTI